MRHPKFSSIGRNLTAEIVSGSTYKTKRKIESIAIHCSFSPQGRGDNANDIDQWHLSRGWSGIGYHYVVLEDGTVLKGRWLDYPGAHIGGFNKKTIGIVRIGGMGPGGIAVNDATPEQEQAIAMLSKLLVEMYDLEPEDVKGHNEFPGVNKACPLMNMDKIRSML